MQQYSAAIVGLGNVGFGYDEYLSHEEYVLTHTQALMSHPGFELIAAVDTCLDKQLKFTKKYNIPAFSSFDELVKKKQPEIYIFALPPEQIESLFLRSLNFSPKMIVCEKPFTTSTKQAETLIAAAKQTQCSIFVNYMRRCEPAVHHIKSLIAEKMLGKIKKIMVLYTGGMITNASHFINLIDFLFGPVSCAKSFINGNVNDFCLQIENFTAYFFHLDECDYHHQEMHIYGEKGILRYDKAGEMITFSPSTPDAIFTDYRTIAEVKTFLTNGMMKYQWHVYEHLYQHLAYKTALYSDGDSALRTLRTLEAINGKIT